MRFPARRDRYRVSPVEGKLICTLQMIYLGTISFPSAPSSSSWFLVRLQADAGTRERVLVIFSQEAYRTRPKAILPAMANTTSLLGPSRLSWGQDCSKLASILGNTTWKRPEEIIRTGGTNFPFSRRSIILGIMSRHYPQISIAFACVLEHISYRLPGRNILYQGSETVSIQLSFRATPNHAVHIWSRRPWADPRQ